MGCVPGRHRMRKRSGAAGAVAAALALIVVVGGSYYGYRRLSEPTCSGEAPLTVSPAPEIAPAIKAAPDAWGDGGAEADGICVAVDVTESDPVDVAAVVAGRHGVSLAGVGQPGGTLSSPDVWVPDSSTWLLRLRGADRRAARAGLRQVGPAAGSASPVPALGRPRHRRVLAQRRTAVRGRRRGVQLQEAADPARGALHRAGADLARLPVRRH